ncbi:MAG: alanine--tRNA ligase [Thermoguttaceae bacterium]|nr:alanine--tRNA ligase [Thermoguttaceae bacterium]
MKTNEIREKYLSFFETKGCVRRPSDVLVPRWDPSVLFTPAGMNQFKDHFLGRCKLEFTRATTCQKCLRTGDIDNVGRTAYHHTFFEMLGNFSFGDYFKREAIHWAWEFLTEKQWLGLDPASLSATVFLDDQEAADIWTNEIGLPKDRLQFLDEDENFWPASAPSQGPDGVCGPCSEIYYHTPLGEVEIWNLVFTQFNRVGDPPNNLEPLPSKNIDTGMGLERTAAALQGVTTNFHIDILKPLVLAAAEVCGRKYDENDLANEDGRRLRRIADHIRACTFAIHENVYPGNKEEKYVIRRLLRRAVLDGVQMGMDKPFLAHLVPVVADLMKTPYPELSETIERVQEIITGEETHFLGTIDAGLGRIENVFRSTKANGGKVISGADAFEMYQTYGFPPELFETMAAEENFGFDWDGFKKEMARHGEISGTGEKNLLFKDDPLDAVKKANNPPEFLGYETLRVDDARVLAILRGGELVDSADGTADEVTILLDKTPFYAEKGGQVGDIGTLCCDKFRFAVSAARYDGEYIVHCGKLTEGAVKTGDIVRAEVDAERRAGTSRAHSATHLLHAALRKHLGGHAEQQGSKVDCDILRFDFTHNKAIDHETLMAIERDVNAMILADHPVVTHVLPIDKARELGAMMLFGEKYPDLVRVVVMGESKELCGGTHLKNTGKVGMCKIIAEESVSAGTRRITALTGMAAVDRVQQLDSLVGQLAGTLKVSLADIPARVNTLIENGKKLRKQLETAARKEGLSVDSLIEGAKRVGGVNVITAALENQDPGILREAIDKIRSKASPCAVVLASKTDEGKVILLAALSKDLVAKKLSSVDWIKAISKPIQGGGGGRPDMAQAGGKNPAGIGETLKAAAAWIEEKLS